MTRTLTAIPVDRIDAPDPATGSGALRDLDTHWVGALAGMIAEEGLLQPIEVVAVPGSDRYELVFGRHRLEAVRWLRWETVQALVDGAPDRQGAARLRAAIENVGRRELSKLDRAVHIAEIHHALEARRGERRGGDRRSLKSKAKSADQNRQVGAFDLSAEVAERVGLSSRAVERAVRIAHGIGPTIRRRIVQTAALVSLADSQVDLERLAGEPDTRQTRILDTIEAPDNAARTVADAIAVLDGEPPEPDADAWLRRSRSGLRRLTPSARRQVFADFRDEIIDLVRAEGWL